MDLNPQPSAMYNHFRKLLWHTYSFMIVSGSLQFFTHNTAPPPPTPINVASTAFNQNTDCSPLLYLLSYQVYRDW